VWFRSPCEHILCATCKSRLSDATNDPVVCPTCRRRFNPSVFKRIYLPPQSHSDRSHQEKSRLHSDRVETLERLLAEEKATNDELVATIQELQEQYDLDTSQPDDNIVETLERGLAEESATNADLRMEIEEIQVQSRSQARKTSRLRNEVETLERILAEESATNAGLRTDIEGLQVQHLSQTRETSRLHGDTVATLERGLAKEGATNVGLRTEVGELRVQCHSQAQETSQLRAKIEDLEGLLAKEIAGNDGLSVGIKRLHVQCFSNPSQVQRFQPSIPSLFAPPAPLAEQRHIGIHGSASVPLSSATTPTHLPPSPLPVPHQIPPCTYHMRRRTLALTSPLIASNNTKDLSFTDSHSPVVSEGPYASQRPASLAEQGYVRTPDSGPQAVPPVSPTTPAPKRPLFSTTAKAFRRGFKSMKH